MAMDGLLDGYRGMILSSSVMAEQCTHDYHPIPTLGAVLLEILPLLRSVGAWLPLVDDPFVLSFS